MSQPDFTAAFFESFKNSSSGYELYRTREGVLFTHDLIFLDSLIHDATFTTADVVKSKQNIVIKMERDCWERNLEKSTKELPKELSLLQFKDVLSVHWVEKNLKFDFKDFDSLQLTDSRIFKISHLFIGESTYLARTDAKEIVLTGYPAFWQLRIFISKENGSVSLLKG